MSLARIESAGHTRPLPRVVDELARTHPDQTWISIPINDNVSNGYRNVSFSRLARVVNKMALWMEKTFGTSDSRETIAYMGANDTRYIVTILAALKTGYKILLTSTRNSIEGQKSLVRATDCKKFLHSSELKKQVHAIPDSDTHIDIYQIPELEQILAQPEGEEHYEGKESDNPNDASIIIHTSGSTGIPKPIPLKNGWLAAVYRIYHTPLPDNRLTMAKKLFDERPIFCALPWFHAMGLFMMLRSLYDQGPLVLPPSSVSPNAEGILEMIRAAKPRHGFFPPAVLEDIVEIEGGLETLGTLEDVYFAGAPLSHDVGERIAKLPDTKLGTIIGSTEAGIIDSYVQQDDADWEYFEWCPYDGAEMQPSGEGLYELVIKPMNNNLQGAFYSFPDITEWRTKDLYEKHPSKPGLWRYKGRNDDVIVLSNGEKFGPVDLEKTVEAHPAVKGAMVVGQGRFQAGLVIEPDPAHAHEAQNDSDAYIEKIWPAVERGNGTVAAHGRVFKSKIALTKPDKPFARAPKGSIMRRQTNNIYEKEIDALYHNESFADQIQTLDPSASDDQVRATVRTALSLALPSVPEDVKDSDNLFDYNIDSLGVLGLSSAINHAMPQGENVIKPRTLYSNPSIDGIVSAVSTILRGGEHKQQKSREQRMADLLAKYTKSLPAHIDVPPRQEKYSVALTGSTGSLGTYLLHQLIKSPCVERVYCLNRSADAQSRQKQAFTSRSLDPDFSKVEFLQSSFGADSFGLSSSDYTRLLDHVSVFIHNAWAVDFNMSLESFDATHISGVYRAITFAAEARYKPHLVFVSSIASVGNWLGSGNKGPVPETQLEIDSVPLPQGYGESKHVASRMLNAAAQKSGIQATVVRVGQLAGPVDEQGVWNKQEWLPSIIASSKELGKAPADLGNMDTVDWVPVDASAKVMAELSLSGAGGRVDELMPATNEGARVFHLVNPKTSKWGDLVGEVRRHFGDQGKQLEVVSFQEWVDTLKGLEINKENAERVPGLKLLDFYEGMAAPMGLPRLATEKTAAASETLKNLGPVNGDMMRTWLEQWKY